ncbi:MAG: ATP-grasp domain-containing protein [Casimicrobiaceae bacterium]
MSTSVLLVSTATNWLGAARMPAALGNAGFDVSLLTPADSLAAKSRYVRRIGYLPQDATPLQWVFAFAAMVKATGPRLVVPCDDTSVRLMQMLVLTPPDNLQSAQYIKLAGLIRESLGTPDYYRASVDKTLLPAAAKALGVRVPPCIVTDELQDACSFAEHQVVIKRGIGAAGEWVAIVPDRTQLEQQFSRFMAATMLEIEGAAKTQVLVQAHISGSIVDQSMVAWQGATLAGFVREKLIKHPPLGPATVVRVLHLPEVRKFSDRLAAGLGMSGFFAIEYIVERSTGDAYLIEINRRATSGITLGAMVGVDLCQALYAALNGGPSSVRGDVDPGEEQLIAHFPEEWFRDPGSRYLREYRIDGLWDDPDVLAAAMALRHAD